MNNKVNSKAKNKVGSNTSSSAASSSSSSSTPTYVEPLPESSRPRKDGPGGN
ncbi:MAG TPA: hypothetical protein VHP81_13210 [Lachnospiraceae bacterium]|nr:hypothetical protein [Lachnospiraceae bacterium]